MRPPMFPAPLVEKNFLANIQPKTWCVISSTVERIALKFKQRKCVTFAAKFSRGNLSCIDKQIWLNVMKEYVYIGPETWCAMSRLTQSPKFPAQPVTQLFQQEMAWMVTSVQMTSRSISQVYGLFCMPYCSLCFSFSVFLDIVMEDSVNGEVVGQVARIPLARPESKQNK